MTKEENLKVAVHPDADLDEAYGLFPEFLQRRGVKAEMLSGGEQQMVVIAHAIINRPRVIIIDEMSPGLAPVIVNHLIRAVQQLTDNGTAIVLVEQFAALALSIGDHAYVMRRGRMVYDCGCEALVADPAHLHRLYLGDATA